MNKSINLKLTVLFAVIALAFGAAFTAFASSDDESDLDVVQDCFGVAVEAGDDCKTSDFNDDGIVNSLDIGPFKEVLDTHDLNDDGEITFEDNEDSDLDVLQSCFGIEVENGDDCKSSDFNDDGIVNSLDIGPFESVLDTHDLNEDGKITFEDNEEEEEEDEDEDEEEEEMSDEEEAAEAIVDAEDAIAEAEAYVDSLIEEEAENCDDMGTIDDLVASDAMCAMSQEVAELGEKLVDAKSLLGEAETAFENEDWEEAEDKAEAAEDLAEEILDDEEENDEDDEDNVCSKSQGRGYGVMTKCVDEDIKDYKKDKEFRSEYREEWKSYGKTTDRTELQAQLRELLLVLIELLQAQMALTDS